MAKNTYIVTLQYDTGVKKEVQIYRSRIDKYIYRLFEKPDIFIITGENENGIMSDAVCFTTAGLLYADARLKEEEEK